jgi:hypothetical protein
MPRAADPAAPPSRRSVPASAAATALTLAICAAGALHDPTGLFALLPGAALDVLPPHGTLPRGLWSAAGVAVFLPVLLGATAWGTAASIRAARPGVGRARILLRVWGVVVLATALARIADVLAELAGTAVQQGGRVLSTAAATALWTCGLTALRAALLGWLPALGAALCYRPDRRTPTASGLTGHTWRWSLAATALPLALLGPLVGPLLWEGSPAGSLYGEPLSLRQLPLGPARFGVELLVTAVVGAVLLTRSSRRFDYTPARDLLLGGWLAALGGGAAAGLVQALLALPRDLDGGDLFAVPDLGARLGAGLSLGAAFGWAVLPTLLLISRALDAMVGARRRFLTVAASTLVLALASWGLSATTPGTLGAPVVTAAALATADQPLPALTVRAAHGSAPAAITDVDGRQVLLRGVNVNQLVDYRAQTPGRQTVRPLSDADFAAMAAMGFNTVRLDISWSALEPRRGHWDLSYLARIQNAVAMAAAHGLYTDIDMHQDAWGASVAAPPGTVCRSGTSPVIGYDGAPAWATITDGASPCQFTGRDITPAVARAFTNFYHDTDGIQTQLVDTWGLLARTFGGDPAVAGYGLLNEPGIGDDPPVTSSVLLGAYDNRAITEIRSQELRAAGGYPHLVFIEPSVLWSGLGFDAAPPRGFSSDPYLVFAPHLYNESITTDQSLGLTLVSVERGFTLAQQQAKEYGMPLWIGEWGWFDTSATAIARMTRFTAAEDADLLGGAYWVWKQACGDPENSQTSATAGNLVGVDCSTGKDLPPDPSVAALLSRAYPRSAPGRLTYLSADTAGRLLLRGSAPAAAGTGSDAGSGSMPTACTLTVWYPGATRPDPVTTGITGVSEQQVPGGWLVTGCAGGAYTLTIGPASTP